MNRSLMRYEDSGNYFACPVCRKKLSLKGTSLVCKNNHCYDISKDGYVNLGLKPQKQKEYDKNSFQNRHYILEHGIYQPIADEIIDFINQTETIHRILDAGCGEGYYAKQIYQHTHKSLCAFDLSKDSIQLASKKDTDAMIKWFVADLAAIPLQDNSMDCILDIFSPANYKEFHRILAPDGYIIKVIPTAEHLTELRQKVQTQLKNKEYSNEKVLQYFEKSFTCIAGKKVIHSFPLSEKEREAFIEMTPLLFHIDKTNIDWSDITQLTIGAELLIGTH